MKILMVAGLFYPAKLGGPANTLFWLAKGFVKNDFDVFVVASSQNIDNGVVLFNQWTTVEGIKVMYCNVRTKLNHRVVWNAWKELRNTDTIILSSVCYLPCFLVALKASIFKKNIIWSPRGELFPTAIANNRFKLAYFRIIKHLLRRKVTFHATSEEEKQQISNIFGKDISLVVIPNYIELPRARVRDRLPVKYLLYVGRINPIKALDNLIKGVATSSEFMKQGFQLWLAGPDQDGYSNVLKELAAGMGVLERVKFLGNIEGDNKFRIYANAQMSCLISHSENFGNVVIEALSQGTPVIASHGTPWQILSDENAGYWIDNSPEQISQCLEHCLTLSDIEYEVMRSNALRLAHTFDVYNNMGSWKVLIQDQIFSRYQ